MTATFSISSAELDASLIEKIRALAQGSNYRVTIRVDEEKVYSEETRIDSKVAEEAVAYTKQLLQKSVQNKTKLDSVKQFYTRYRADMSGFKFNRDEANER